MFNHAIGNPLKYNPQLWSSDELRQIFVARQHELDDIMQRIRDANNGQTVQHALITGARGMGKSTLLNRIALAVHDDAALAQHWLPLRMPEEQYTVAKLNELWLNILGVLADYLEQQQQDAKSEQLDQAVAALKPLNAEQQADAARDLLLTWCQQQHKRLLLLVDGTDMLFNSLNNGKADSQLWSLRKTLMQHTELFWVGASYQALESQQHYHEAFHDFFEILELRPLSLQDMRNALLALAETFGTAQQAPGLAARQAMQATLDAQPERLKTLRQISGGNPRTTVILFELFAQGNQADIHADLKVLLDNLTPHYKARMESHLAEQPRKIMAHIMEHWQPVGLGELADISGIASTTLSGQLKRLEQDGYIEKTKLSGSRSAGYQASERLFNIWHLMRNAPRRVRQKLSWLIEFIRLWYSTQELGNLVNQRVYAHRSGQLQSDSDLEISLAYASALPDGSCENYQNTPNSFANHARLAVKQQAPEKARMLYRSVAELAQAQGQYENLLLQAQLYLGNRDAARLALEQLAQPAQLGEQEALLRLKEQVCELSAMGLGLALAELMQQSSYADFLAPFSLALRAIEQPDALDGSAQEIKCMALEVLADITTFRNTHSR